MTAPTPLAAPRYAVHVAGQDVTELVDMDTLHRTMSERGEGSATIEIPVASENDVPFNGIARDAVAEVWVDGSREWLGKVVWPHKPKPEDLTWQLDCAGGWEDFKHADHWCMGFVESRYDGVTEYDPRLYDTHGYSGMRVSNDIDINTDGQLQFTIPKGTRLQYLQGRLLYIWPLGGMDPDLRISRVTGSWSIGGGADTETVNIRAFSGTPFAGGVHAPEDIAYVDTYNDAGTSTLDTDTDGLLSGDWCTHLRIDCTSSYSGTGVTTSEEFFQLTGLTIYLNRTTKPRIDEVVAAIDADVRPAAPAPSTESIGSALAAFMCDPFQQPADGIGYALTKAAVPPLCGVFAEQLVLKNRPTTPPDLSRLWVVSEVLTPGLQWGVEIDEEQSKDYVAVSYSILGDTTIPDGTPQVAYYPSAPPDSLARTGLIDGGDLTAAEAAAAAAQAHAYLHNLASGPVTIPHVCHNGLGQECVVDGMRAWDWVVNVGRHDQATAGPFLVSGVEHQGGVAQLSIGATEAYQYNGPERIPTKGRYVGAHRERRKYKKRVAFAAYWKWRYRKFFKKHHRYPAMPKKHAKYGTIRGFKWVDVEGRYV